VHIMPRIQDLPPASALEATDLVPLEQAGGTRKATLEEINAFPRLFSGVKLSGGTMLFPDGVDTVALFGGADFDTDGYWDIGSPAQIVVPFPGFYSLVAIITPISGGGVGTLRANWRDDGAPGDFEYFAVTWGEGPPSLTLLVHAQTGRVGADNPFSLHLFQNTGAIAGVDLSAWVVYQGDNSKPPPPPPIVSQDHFVDADGTALAAHTMDIGTGWSVIQGTWKIQSNRAQQTGTLPYQNALTDCGVSDCTIQCALTWPASGNFAAGLAIRAVDSDHSWYARVNNVSGNFILVERNTGDVIRDTATYAPTPGATDTITIVCNSDTITATVNGAHQVSYHPATYNQAVTAHGLWCYQDGGTYAAVTNWNDWQVTD
jgi:hypothetical protein